MKSVDLTQANIDKISELFPNVITEVKDEQGKIKRAVDFDLLKQELSDFLVEGEKERYQLTWPGKKEAILNANTPIDKTLRPVKEESVDWDNTQNLYIEGDNLEVLKLLQESYLNKVKCIYIDPPYNTGNDFIYRDNYRQAEKEYLDASGQTDEEGNQLVSNPVSNGRFHSDWLTMMYSRIKIARHLLREDGVLFVSIDDNEVDNLKKICDEIFGREHYVAQFPWRKRTAKSDVPFGVSQDYEWVVCYAKSSAYIASIEGKEREYYETPDLPNRPWRIHDLTKQTSASERPNSFFTMVNPKTGEEYPANPNRTWAITVDTFQQYFDEHRIVFPGDYDFLKISKPVFRYFKEDDMKKAGDLFGYVVVSTNLPKEVGMTQDGTKDIGELVNGKIFGFPKPIELIKYFIKISTNNDKEAIILDFFSGSATTAHAVMKLNAEDGGQRKYIMVQLPEKTDETSEAYKAGFKNICEIGKERIRRAAKKIKEETGADIDYGFRVFRVDSSNMKDVYYTPDKLKQGDLFDLVSNIKEDRTGEDLLIQVMLELGLQLSLPMETKQLEGKRVHYVAGNSLIACFDDNVPESVIKQIAADQPLRVVFRDSSFADDSARINVEELFKMLSPGTEIQVL